MPKKYNPEEKARILARAAEIGAAAAAREAGVSYNGLLKWMHAGKASAVKAGMEMTGDLVERLSAQISMKEEEIKELEESLKGRKAELKELLKAKVKAEKEKEAAKAAEEKKKLVEAVMSSGRSMEEILEFLNK
jgi:transposase-like protein